LVAFTSYTILQKKKIIYFVDNFVKRVIVVPRTQKHRQTTMTTYIPTPEPIIEIAEIINPTPVTGAIDAEPIVVADSNNQQWRLVSVDDEYCNFEAVEHREIGCNPRSRKMATKALQKLYGWDKPKCKFTRPLIGENGIEVHTDDRRYGFALAEPIWAERESDADIDLAFERSRIERMWDRDCDRAANFGMRY
jgi:hypothetical protein